MMNIDIHLSSTMASWDTIIRQASASNCSDFIAAGPLLWHTRDDQHICAHRSQTPCDSTTYSGEDRSVTPHSTPDGRCVSPRDHILCAGRVSLEMANVATNTLVNVPYRDFLIDPQVCQENRRFRTASSHQVTGFAGTLAWEDMLRLETIANCKIIIYQ